MERNTGTDHIVQRLSGAHELAKQSNEIATLHARVEELEEFVRDLADESCLDRGSHRNQEVCGETNLRLIDYCGPCRARALLEKKP